MKKVTLANVKKAIKNDGRWTGYIVANKVAPYHINAGWYLGHRVDVETVEALEATSRNYQYYNCNYELGYGLHYYEV